MHQLPETCRRPEAEERKKGAINRRGGGTKWTGLCACPRIRSSRQFDGLPQNG